MYPALAPSWFRRRSWRLLALSFLLAGWSACAAGSLAAHAQSAAEETRAAVYRYARPGETTMRVGVWGSVTQPGLYEVAPETDLMTLLSISGGPLVSLQDPGSRQTITLRVARPIGGGGNAASDGALASETQRRVVFEAAIEEIAGLERALPDVQSGDVITVEKTVRERFSWRDGLSVLQATGTLALLLLNILRES